MNIRQEKPSDYGEVYDLVTLSFATAPHGDGTEADYLNELRNKDVFIPALSLVAEEDGKIVGQIVLYRMYITTPGDKQEALVLSPICVHPSYFRQGIARAMTEEAFTRAAAMGYSAAFLCGDPEIYRRLGFRPTFEYGIFHVTDNAKRAQWCMARELVPGALEGIEGTLDIC